MDESPYGTTWSQNPQLTMLVLNLWKSLITRKLWCRYAWRPKLMELNLNLCPMIVFHDVKREKKALGEEFKNRYVVSSSTKALINEELALLWVERVLGAFSFHQRLLAWNSFDCHMVSGVKEALKRINIDQVIIPGEWRSTCKLPMYAGINLSRQRLQKNITSGWAKAFTNLRQVAIWRHWQGEPLSSGFLKRCLCCLPKLLWNPSRYVRITFQSTDLRIAPFTALRKISRAKLERGSFCLSFQSW